MPNLGAFFFNARVLSEGFTYDTDTGTFTAVNPGVYYFSIRIDVDDGTTGAVPRQNYIALAGVPRGSDSWMDCQVPTTDNEYPCSVSFIMEFESANQPFTLTNVGDLPVYYGSYDGNPFTDQIEMSVFQLD